MNVYTFAAIGIVAGDVKSLLEKFEGNVMNSIGVIVFQ